MSLIESRLIRSISTNLINKEEFYSISKYSPRFPFELYFQKSTKWLSHIEKFGGKHGCLYRTISRMPDTSQWLREEECMKNLKEGKIKGFYIISDSLRGPVIICYFNLEVNGILVSTAEHLKLSFNPALSEQNQYGFYSYLCDETESTPEFVKLFNEFISGAQKLIKESYENPVDEIDLHLARTINFITTVETFPDQSFRIGQFGSTIYTIYKKDGHTCWIRLGSWKDSNIYAMKMKDFPMQWFDEKVSELVYDDHLEMFDKYFENIKSSEFREDLMIDAI